MFRFLASLFAHETPPRPATGFRPQVGTLEDRDIPAVVPVNPMVLRGFDPQPEPPATIETRTFVIEGGLTARGIIIEGGLTARGIISIY